MLLYGIFYKKGAWFEEEVEAMANEIRLSLKGNADWSKMETVVLERAIAMHTREQPKKDLWTGDDLLLLALDIADAMVPGLWGTGSWSEDGLNGVHAAVMAAVRQVYCTKNQLINPESQATELLSNVSELYSIDYEAAISLSAQHRDLDKASEAYKKMKWNPLAFLIQRKVPLATIHQIKVRKTGDEKSKSLAGRSSDLML